MILTATEAKNIAVRTLAALGINKTVMSTAVDMAPLSMLTPDPNIMYVGTCQLNGIDDLTQGWNFFLTDPTGTPLFSRAGLPNQADYQQGYIEHCACWGATGTGCKVSLVGYKITLA